MAGNSETALRVRGYYERLLEPGETVFDEGDRGERLYVIQSGEVEISREGPGGHKDVARLGAGDFFGELGAVLGQRNAGRAVAVNKTRVLQLDRETLESMCLAQPEIAIRMIRVLVSRLIEAERRLACLGVGDLLRPMVHALVRAAEPHEDKGGRIATTLRRLATETGLSMVDAHRALHQLIDRRLLQLVDDVLFAPDLHALSACLDAPD